MSEEIAISHDKSSSVFQLKRIFRLLFAPQQTTMTDIAASLSYEDSVMDEDVVHMLMSPLDEGISSTIPFTPARVAGASDDMENQMRTSTHISTSSFLPTGPFMPNERYPDDNKKDDVLGTTNNNNNPHGNPLFGTTVVKEKPSSSQRKSANSRRRRRARTEWYSARDPKTGDKYYFNPSTGRS